MSWKDSKRVSTRLLRGVLVLAVAAAAATSASAQLIDNPSYVTYTAAASPAMPTLLPPTTASSLTPPPGFWDERGTVPVTLNYQRDNTTAGGPYLTITISNNTSVMGNYTLHASPDRAIAVGNVARSKIGLVVAQAPSEVFINAGFYQYAGSTYNGQLESETSVVDGARTTLQNVSAELVGGTKSWGTNLSTTQAHAILSAYNIPPGGVVVLRVKSWTLDNGVTAGNGIMPLSILGRQQNTGPSKNFKVSVEMIGKSFSGPYVSTLEVVNNLGVIKQSSSHASTEWSTQYGRIVDNFILDMSAASMPVGDYTLRYKVAPSAGAPGIQLGTTSTSVAEVNYLWANPADYRYRIGNVTVSATGGLHLGMSFHYYPGASDTQFGAPYGTYKFVRSLASDKLWKPWWNVNPDGSLNTTDPNRWTDLDAWANKFAATGQRKLLLTFFGSPTAASSNPTLISNAWGTDAPGISAAPKDLNVFRQAVEATVSHLSGRVFAVECWNEPNSRDMFSGDPSKPNVPLSTQLADICQRVYEGTKAIDSSIPVICPQADSPYTAGYVYSAKTSAGNPITNYCDWVGAHIYSRLSNDTHSKPYATQSLNQALRLLKVRSQQYGISAKKLAVTEFGLNRCTWSTTPAYGRVGPGQTLDDLANGDKADAMFQATMTMHEEGVTALGLYSYDHGDDDPTCRRGGSYIWSTLGSDSSQYLNSAVLDAFGNARNQVGTTTTAAP